MQYFGYNSDKEACDALEEELDEKIAENLEGQTAVTSEEVKASWLAYNDFADFLWRDGGDWDVDKSAFLNSIWGHFLSQYESIKV